MHWLEVIDRHNEYAVHSRESPSSNGISNAYSLSKIVTILFEDNDIISKEGRERALRLSPDVYEALTHLHIRFSSCGLGYFDSYWGLLNGFYGWHGLGKNMVLSFFLVNVNKGGQLLMFDPKRNLSVSYITTQMSVDPPWFDKRSDSVLKELLEKLDD